MKRPALTLLIAGCAASPPPPPEVPASTWRARAPAADDVIYLVMVDRFANGDPDNDANATSSDPRGWHGGDLQGVIDHLDELDELGVKTVWLTPIFKGRETDFRGWGPFHGYWVHGLDNMDPRFGTVRDLQWLSDGLHDRGMRLMLDMVYNHVDYDAPMVTEHPTWFHDAPSIEDWTDPVALEQGQVHGLPDLNQDNPEVATLLTRQTLTWIQSGRVDGLRIDAVRHISPRFVADLSAAARASAGEHLSVLGEIFDGDPEKLIATWRSTRTEDTRGLDAAFDFPLYYAMTDVFCDRAPVGRLAEALAGDRTDPAPGRWVTFLDNHDTPRLASRCPVQANAHAALLFQLTARGTPSITWGTETGLEGEEEPDNRRDMVFKTDHPTREFIKNILDFRSMSPALLNGRTRVVYLDSDLVIFVRQFMNDAVWVAVNTSTEAARFTPAGTITSVSVPPLSPGSWSEGTWTIPPGTALLTSRTDRARPGSNRTVRFTSDPTEALRVAGAGPSLGSWDPERALDISTGAGEISLPIGTVIAFKTVTATLPPMWSDPPNQFVLVTDDDGDLVVPVSAPSRP